MAGQPFWLEPDIAPPAGDSGWDTHWMAIERDASDRMALAERLQRCGAVDRLSGGIARDANQELTVAMANAGLLTPALGEQPLLREMAAQITAAARRGSALEKAPWLAPRFTDPVLPGGRFGRELAAAARALRPDLPVILRSGCPDAAHTRAASVPSA